MVDAPESHDRIDDDLRALAFDFAMGTHADEDYGRHLSACRVCADEVSRLATELATTLESGVHADPPADLWARVESRIAKSPTHAAPQAVVRRSNEAEWRNTDVPGVRYRVLHAAADGATHTVMYEMDAGASYPSHEHTEREECYVISGDLIHGEDRYGPGDFLVMPKGSTHEVQRSETGCRILVMCSRYDRRVG